MTAPQEPFIRLRNVRKVYRSQGQEFLAVSDVTMDVQEGELISLVGPSGCGKTTVLKILAGLHDSDGGTIRIGNARTPLPGRAIFSIWSGLPAMRTNTRSNCPAECSSAPRSHAPSSTIQN